MQEQNLNFGIRPVGAAEFFWCLVTGGLSPASLDDLFLEKPGTNASGFFMHDHSSSNEPHEYPHSESSA